jgi:hypothetical protein
MPPDAGPDAGPADLGFGAIGASCNGNADCDTSKDFTCWSQGQAPYLWGGDCVLAGCSPGCPPGSACITFQGQGVSGVKGCMESCTSDNDCRADNYCMSIPMTTLRICYPKCRDDLIDCSPRDGTKFCDRMSGQCESDTQSGTSPVGGPCMDTRDCAAGEVCMGEFAWGFVGGMCTRVCSGLPEATPCATGQTCQSFAGIGLCFVDCTNSACPARAGALCSTLDPTWPKPSCIPQ